jgi:hypothetical protein
MTVKQNSEQMMLGMLGGSNFLRRRTGDNIPVTKSKYKIYFNDLDGSYLMIPNQECIKLY